MSGTKSNSGDPAQSAKQQGASKEFFSPRRFLQARRPEKFSDSVVIQAAALDRSMLEYQLDTLTSRKQEGDFERLAKKLVERSICPNLLPQTGPTGGGDSKVDSETYPVSDELSLFWLVGTSGDKAGSERWAFAFSAKKDWGEKLRSDISKIAATNRGYKKAFFVTNQFVPDRKRADEEDRLREQYKLDVRILDRSWILDRVFEGKLEDIAIEELNLSSSLRPKKKNGPMDVGRKERLDELEQRINAYPNRQFGIQLAADCIESAELARSLDLPRTDVDGRFQRAERVAKERGTQHQQLNAAYQWAWATYWWFEDHKTFNDMYSKVEELSKGSLNAYDLELLSNLWSLLSGAVRHGFMTSEEARLETRYGMLASELERVGKEETRPSSALQAKAQRLLLELVRGTADVDGILKKFEELIAEGDRLIGFPIVPLVELLIDIGSLLEGHPAYNALFETMVKIRGRREGESSSALLLLKRAAQQIDAERPYEAIKIAGRALALLSKEENRDDLIEALCICGGAYERVGLLWAARGAFLSAASLATGELDSKSEITAYQAVCFNRVKWLELRLGRLPHTLAWHEVDTIIRAALAHRGYPEERLCVGEGEYETVLGILLLKADMWQLKQMSRMPDTLVRLGLPIASGVLKFALGYPKEMPREFYAEFGEDIYAVMSLLRDQPVSNELPIKPSLWQGRKVEFKSRILGCKIEVESDNASPSIEVAESFLGALESFLATGDSHQVYAREPVLTVKVRGSDFVEGLFRFELSDRGGRPHVDLFCGDFNPNAMSLEAQSNAKDKLFELAIHVLDRVFLVQDIEKLGRDLFHGEDALNRSIDFTSSLVVAGNVLGDSPKTSIDAWTAEGSGDYPLKRTEEWDASDRQSSAGSISGTKGVGSTSGAEKPAASLMHNENIWHTQMETVSLIRENLWDKAGWFGIGFFFDAPGPIMALLFKDEVAARDIFSEWRKELGERDADNRLRLSVIQGIDKTRPLDYRIVIGTNVGKGREGIRYLMISRINRMEPSSDRHLQSFLTAYRKLGVYALAHAVIVDQNSGPILSMENCIIKRDIHVRQAWEIGLNDPDIAGVSADDQPITPPNRPDVPVFELLRWMKEMSKGNKKPRE